MFGWFRPTCPVDAAAKSWIEDRIRWLGEQFGTGVFLGRDVILPTEKYFPDAFDSSNEAVRTLLVRVCGYMDVDPCRTELQIFTDSAEFWLVNDRGQPIPRAAGLYDEQLDKAIIHLEQNEIGDPVGLVGTMAHELAHLRLLGERRVSADEYDHELLTDLTVVFHGLGIFLANSPRTWDSQYTEWPGTTLRKPEYMTLPMYGYALAHASWLRGERNPAWAKHLRIDARACFKQGLRYLWETGDSGLNPNLMA